MNRNPCVVGHPFMTTGRGEDARSCYRALSAAGFKCNLRDIYGIVENKDPAWLSEFSDVLTTDLGDRLNIFILNGDEIPQAMAHLASNLPPTAHKVLYPAWELSKYPDAWKVNVELFDEVWASSKFTAESLRGTVSRPVIHLPLPCEPVLQSFLGRKHFGISETAFVFLFMFDFTSYMERKNPFAVLDAYRSFRQKHPYRNCRLVIKLNGSAERHEAYVEFKRRVESFDDLHIIEQKLSDNEIKNLVRNCDCFVSLHRSEGFGRGLSEAMYFGKPVIGTAYSGNVDFMNSDNSCLVPYELIPLAEGQYPFWQGQVWAGPRTDVAAEFMDRLTCDREFGRHLGREASRHIRQNFGYRACGVRYADRCETILSGARENAA